MRRYAAVRTEPRDQDQAVVSCPYLAGWSEQTPIATLERTAALIDRLSRRIEDTVTTIALADTSDTADAPATAALAAVAGH